MSKFEKIKPEKINIEITRRDQSLGEWNLTFCIEINSFFSTTVNYKNYHAISPTRTFLEFETNIENGREHFRKSNRNSIRFNFLNNIYFKNFLHEISYIK